MQILVDGREAFADELPGWRGFDPADVLGDHSPLLPDDLGRRVAVYRCSCGTAGCGVIAPSVYPSRRTQPEPAARDILGQLQAVPPDQWPARFGERGQLR